MNKVTVKIPAMADGDLVLQEIWRAKDALSASYGHDLEKLISLTRKREKLSGHPLIKPPAKTAKP